MEPSNKKVIGIQNTSNNCYLNSVIQLLCNIPELQSMNYNKDKVYKNFLDTYDNMYDIGNNIIDNENILDISSLKKVWKMNIVYIKEINSKMYMKYLI